MPSVMMAEDDHNALGRMEQVESNFEEIYKQYHDILPGLGKVQLRLLNGQKGLKWFVISYIWGISDKLTGEYDVILPGLI